MASQFQRQIWAFEHAELKATVTGLLRKRPTTGNDNTDFLGTNQTSFVVAVAFIELVMVENREFVVGILTVSLIVPEI